MIPISYDIIQNSVSNEQTSYTYQIKSDLNQIKNYTDGISAIKQAIYKILMTEKNKFPIYGENYGVSFDDLIGQSLYYAQTEIPTRITNALLNDSRILQVYDFSFQKPDEKGNILVKFFVSSIFGEVDFETEVSI